MATQICRRKLADKVFLLVAIVFLVYVLPDELVASRKLQSHDDGNSKFDDEEWKIKETRYSDNEAFDCVDIYKQPAFDHPLLKDHIIQVKPSSNPEENEASQILQGESTLAMPTRIVDCPEGTIPILRTTKNKTVTKSARSFPQTKQLNQSVVALKPEVEGHEYAQVTIKQSQGYKGAQGKLNVWIPNVEDGELSLAQIWVVGGDGDDLNTVEAGWRVAANENPHRARIFIYWTADNYVSTGCYDLDCPGFVQVNRQVLLGSALEPLSSYNGKQFDIDVNIHKDPATGNWWLRLQNVDLGYWPSSLFTSLGDSASMISWGGEVTNNKPQGHHTTTQMGSGHFPTERLGKSAYISNLMYVDGSGTQRQPENLILYATNAKCYDILQQLDSAGVTIYFGGPGFSEQCP